MKQGIFYISIAVKKKFYQKTQTSNNLVDCLSSESLQQDIPLYKVEKKNSTEGALKYILLLMNLGQRNLC